MNVVFTPYGFEWRIRSGRDVRPLLRPVHPIHYDLAYFAGWKVVWFVMWLPIAAALSLLFRPTLHPEAVEIAVFAVAIWGAYLIRSLFQWLIGMVTFCTTRVAALFDIYFVAELMLSGRLVPMSLMPSLGATWRTTRRSSGRSASRSRRSVGQLGTRDAAAGPGHPAALDRHRSRACWRSPGGPRCAATRRWATDARPAARSRCTCAWSRCTRCSTG